MTAHQLAKALLAGPDVPVVINGWGSDEGGTYEVTKIGEMSEQSFNGENDTPLTARDDLGYTRPRLCVYLNHADTTPLSKEDVDRERQATLDMEQARYRLSPEAFNLLYPEIVPMSPEDFESISTVAKNLNN